MDAATVRARLQAEGISVTTHRDGAFTASLTKPADESWSLHLRDRVKALPGAEVRLIRERPAADRYFTHNEIVFRVGPEPTSAMVGFGAGSAA